MATELVCDESGAEGEKLIGGTTRMFTHASVRLSPAEGTYWLGELRRRAPTMADEYKANHILRDRHRRALIWLFGPDGPMSGKAHVYLADKYRLATEHLAELSGRDLSPYRDRPDWPAFLGLFNEVARGKLDRSELFGHPYARELLAEDTEFTGLLLDPLIGAIAHAVNREGDEVHLVHDVQRSLTPQCLDDIRGLVHSGQLTGVSFADSATDARIQVVDVIAGTVRRIAENAVLGRPDPELLDLVRPYIEG
ncbi:NAD-dependent protein deacetylase of SIR2 family [Pseudonocardiaceae bacterium YIM PH 21723]|nr:NAD-dependent protein deacetylase of SIR2 family [Pseudonocardiaceae bacterium YIM PH 21723]